MDLGRASSQLLPGYKTGTLIQVGNDANIFLRGTLQDDQGNPIAYASGSIVSRSDKTWKPLTLFTNKVGRFALLGFKAGEYTIQLTTPEPQTIPFMIPADTSGVYTIDSLKVAKP
ncbi:MAG: carboxypeptidase regulatory-like domain-containing protein [Alkalinema sp. RL_2_19]|nr:carboxypeptidase regulatory-like domain-containing protein [Alkalinema sp. RL_2_19]